VCDLILVRYYVSLSTMTLDATTNQSISRVNQIQRNRSDGAVWYHCKEMALMSRQAYRQVKEEKLEPDFEKCRKVLSEVSSWCSRRSGLMKYEDFRLPFLQENGWRRSLYCLIAFVAWLTKFYDCGTFDGRFTAIDFELGYGYREWRHCSPCCQSARQLWP